MRRWLLPQQGHQCGVLKRVFIGNAQRDDGFAAQLRRELRAQAVSVAAFQYEDDFGPTQVTGRYTRPGPGSVPAERASWCGWLSNSRRR